MPLFSHALPPLAELEARLLLHCLPDIGPAGFHRLIAAFGSAAQALDAPAGAWRSLRFGQATLDARHSPQVHADACAAMAWLERPGQHLLMWDQADYPALLAEIADPPPLLFVAGNPAILEKPQLAIVGSRRASPIALDNARAFARSLAAAGFVITSGLALGVDGVAHQAALDVQGETVAVLGTGLQKLYPQRHCRLAEAMIAQGSALVSEFPLNAHAQPGNFPRRNRIISGLSLGVLVVEASPASGSLITARLANEQGREVYALPGSIHHPGARGCHQLIREGAQLVETVEHILQGLRGWQQVVAPAPAVDGVPGAASHPLLALLRAAPLTSEALARSSGRALAEVLASLTELEVQGLVTCEAGRWFARVS